MYSWLSRFLKKRCSSLATFLHDLLGVCSSGSSAGGGAVVSVVVDGVSVVSIVGVGAAFDGCVAESISACSSLIFLLSKIEFLSKNKAIATMNRRMITLMYDRFAGILRFVFFMGCFFLVSVRLDGCGALCGMPLF